MNVYLVFLILAGAAEGLLLYPLALNLRAPAQRTSLALFWFLAGGTGLLITYSLSLALASPTVTVLAAQLQYAFLGALPVLWLFFALEYSGQKTWLQPMRAWLFGVVPLLTFLLVLTNPWHRLIWESYRLVEQGRFLLFRVEHYGAWFWVHLAYSYALMLAGGYWILRECGGRHLPRYQMARQMVALALLPLAFNLFDLFYALPHWGQGLTPLGFALSGIGLGGLLLRYRGLNQLPIARQAVFDHLSEGVIILDHQLRVVDLNHAAQRLFQLERVAWVGESVAVLFPFWHAGLIPSTSDPLDVDLCLRSAETDVATYYQVRVIMLTNAHGRGLGYVITLSDQTERITYLQAIEQEAQTDPLTGLFNRRMFWQIAARAVAHSQVTHQPLALIEIDLDHFKAINDACGHLIGDAVLVEIGHRIQGVLRATDVLGRLGGDELVALLPAVTMRDAESIAQRMRREVADRPIQIEGWAVMCTISLGVAVTDGACPLTLEQLVDQADRALYRVKRRGGNAVEMEIIAAPPS
ncbi:diguanylate cyclase [Thermanaerothrix sp. 4228-RoL]|jgi:diguanylate cyclase (GGDEF)-like protein|uniref:Diguanylate cyclase n=1 Tax=Thermanaerothrix solaris TaxID=3058434 RepID=A0ABU3NNB6_9CHLR|nr:diguanylate cyclase [Thermanaerothrix sp. 4228-RoL]MDT8898349.1 diguanylate cyclase [Thermanaerothrix sp. 4228-RoL]